MPKISYFAKYVDSTTAGGSYDLGKLNNLVPGYTILYGIAILQIRGNSTHDLDGVVMALDYLADPFVIYVARATQSGVYVQYSIIWK